MRLETVRFLRHTALHIFWSGASPSQARVSLSVKAANVIYQFGDILRSVELPEKWREVIAARCSQEIEESEDTERVKKRRADLEAEQKRLVTAFTKGYMTEEDLDAQVERIRSELFSLPIPIEQDKEAITQAALSAGETLTDMAGYWSEATPEERRDIVGGLLMVEGLIYDLDLSIWLPLTRWRPRQKDPVLSPPDRQEGATPSPASRAPKGRTAAQQRWGRRPFSSQGFRLQAKFAKQ